MFALTQIVRILPTRTISTSSRSASIFGAKLRQASRTYHSSPSLFSWRTTLRSDLKVEGKTKSTKEDTFWWMGVPTIKIAEKLAYHINETKDPIRYGPVQILLEKAENIDHLLIGLQGIFWLQEHRSMDMGPEIIGLICRTGARLGVPHLINQVIGTTWCRFWPTSNAMSSLFEFYAKEARRVARNTPVGPRSAEEKPAEETKEEETDEDADLDAVPKVKPLTGDMKEFSDAYNESVRVLTKHFKLNPSAQIITSMLRYHSARGETEEVERVLSTYSHQKMNKSQSVDEARMFSLLRNGKAQEVVDYFNNNKLNERPNKFIKTALFGAYVQLGDVDNAVKILKESGKVSAGHLMTAFKDEARAETIKQVVERFKTEVPNAEFSESAQQVSEDLLADRTPTFPIEEQESEE